MTRGGVEVITVASEGFVWAHRSFDRYRSILPRVCFEWIKLGEVLGVGQFH
jgi:hypothetical protein